MKSLDELYLLCRDEISKEYILEAIKCYKAGSYRSCIVATWIALVYDFIGKLQELSFNDNIAKALYLNIEDYRLKNNISGTLDFERNLLDTMKTKFELLSPPEYDALKRLNDDRNLCAHPSLRDEVMPFEATAEMARYHLRNVIEFVLSKPPVQGKAALGQVLKMIESSYYPKDSKMIEKAIIDSPLGRAKDNLKIKFLYTLIDKIMDESVEVKLKKKFVNTLPVFVRLNYELAEKRFISKGLKIQEPIDANKMYFYCAILIKVPDLLSHISNVDRIRVNEYLKTDSCVGVLKHFYKFEDYKAAVNIRLDNLECKDLVTFLQVHPINKYMEKVIDYFGKSSSWKSAAYNFLNYIIPLGHQFDKKQVNNILKAIIDNHQILESHGMTEYYMEFCKTLNDKAFELDIWKEFISKEVMPKEANEFILSKFRKLGNIK